MLGYRHYADDLVDYFVKKSIDNGIDILRIFDALNDVRNLETAINAAKKYGAWNSMRRTGQVFRLWPRRPGCIAFPCGSHSGTLGSRDSSITAAVPRRSCTCFPILPASLKRPRAPRDGLSSVKI